MSKVSVRIRGIWQGITYTYENLTIAYRVHEGYGLPLLFGLQYVLWKRHIDNKGRVWIWLDHVVGTPIYKLWQSLVHYRRDDDDMSLETHMSRVKRELMLK